MNTPTRHETTPPFAVKKWQTYVPCSTLHWQPAKPFVVMRVVGDKVEVYDPTGGHRMGGRRWVALRNLHETDRTKAGKQRKTGWRLHCERLLSKHQELCGTCMNWLDPQHFGVLAWGFGHNTCTSCRAEIEARYGKLPTRR
ncbi:hypothetical protein [Streptomyces sp. NPDC007088]|uniref:hypothetical protein n=1 Tax=Streptomyces sp. NPDC007088 TaxID=3364773 RepID=UPI0036A29095